MSTVLRIARDGRGTVLRLAEVSGRSASVVVASTHTDAPIRQSDIVERRGRVLSAGADLRLQLRPWEVRTILVDAAGAEAEASEL